MLGGKTQEEIDKKSLAVYHVKLRVSIPSITLHSLVIVPQEHWFPFMVMNTGIEYYTI